MVPAKLAVDCHAHVFSADAPAIAGARYRPAYEATLDAWRAQWVRSGVTHGVLVQPSFFGTDNGEMLAAISRAPSRLRGVAVVDGATSEDEIERLHAGGVRAVRLNLQGVSSYAAFETQPWRILFKRIARRGWHVETFVGRGRCADLAAVLAGSSVDIVFDHFANPAADARPTFQALHAMSKDRRVWIKLSAPYRTMHSDPRVIACEAIESVGSERLVWGSDWPWTRNEGGRDYVESLRMLEEWVGAERMGRMLWDNAAALYGFHQGPPTC